MLEFFLKYLIRFILKRLRFKRLFLNLRLFIKDFTVAVENKLTKLGLILKRMRFLFLKKKI